MKRVAGVFTSVFLLLLLWGGTPVQAAVIGYVPMDDRPVNLEYVAGTLRAAGTDLMIPPAVEIAGRQRPGNVLNLWEWVFETAAVADAMVLSADSMIYGGLVASRTHSVSQDDLLVRVEKFRKLKRRYPSLRLYVFGTIMRTPKMSAGRTEPLYYETLGPSIFRLTALEDKREISGLGTSEAEEMTQLLSRIPTGDLADWRNRRAKNFCVNEQLQKMVREEILDYFLLGRDDSSPLSASHQEFRHLQRKALGIGAPRYLSLPGADNMGMAAVVKAVNDNEFQQPFVKVFYAPGAGGDTVASYEDLPLSVSVPQHIIAAGGLKLDLAEKPDLILAVHTPADGVTRESSHPQNVRKPGSAVKEYVNCVGRKIINGNQVAVGDVSFANGADNSLMHEMKKQGLLDRLVAYSGWNTAGNTIGYAVGQGMLAARMQDDDRKKMLAVRYLDDWGYQANIRSRLYREIVYPAGNDGQWLNELTPVITREAVRRIRLFAANNLWPFPEDSISADFSWGRMFELGVHIR